MVHGDGLVGRRVERARLAMLVDGARAGRGGAVLVEGAPGVGKSALVGALDVAGLRVLRATGAETEIDLPWAGVAELAAPLADDVLASLVPEVQRAALSTALARTGPSSPLGEDRGLVLHAFAGLLVAAAARGPLAVCIDDVQWLDPSSEEAIRFVARRAERLGVAV